MATLTQNITPKIDKLRDLKLAAALDPKLAELIATAEELHGQYLQAEYATTRKALTAAREKDSAAADAAEADGKPAPKPTHLKRAQDAALQAEVDLPRLARKTTDAVTKALAHATKHAADYLTTLDAQLEEHKTQAHHHAVQALGHATEYEDTAAKAVTLGSALGHQVPRHTLTVPSKTQGDLVVEHVVPVTALAEVASALEPTAPPRRRRLRDLITR